MKDIRIIINCEREYIAETLMRIASEYEHEMGVADWIEVEHGCGFIEEVEIPSPLPSLAEQFDEAFHAKAREREAERLKLKEMDSEERRWIEETIPKLEFLNQRGFKVTKYFGGIVDGWPCNYIRIEKLGNCWVEIEGSTIRKTDGTIDFLSPLIYNTEVMTMEKLIKRIAEW